MIAVHLYLAEGDGVVEYVDANKIVVKYDLTQKNSWLDLMKISKHIT